MACQRGLGAGEWEVCAAGCVPGKQSALPPGDKLYIETHDNSEADARLCNGRPKPASALGLLGEADAKRNIHSIRPYLGGV
jgi:hypothetical protein